MTYSPPHPVIVELTRIRRAKGLTQQNVADRMSVSRSWIGRLETRGVNHTLAVVEAYATAVGAFLLIGFHPGAKP